MIETLTRGRSRDKLESFVAKHEEQFWNTIDENIIELTDSFENEFNATLGGELKKFVAKAGFVHTLGSQQKIQLQQRARKFLNQATLSELPSVISALSDYTRGRQDKYFVTVDGLDEHWVDEDIKFQLIQAMFESLKGLKKLRNFQVVVSLRNDLYVRMIQETPSARRQIEKYDDLIIRMKWSGSQLKELAEKRIREMCRRKYSSSDVGFTDVFKQNPTTKDAPWDYLYERTLRRPRDIINFINLAMQAAEGKSAVSKNAFLKGEANYSNLRHETLIHEWSGTFPGIAILLEQLRGRPAYRNASELAHSKFVDELYDSFGQDSSLHNDKIWVRLASYVNDNAPLDPIELSQMVLFRLHLIGAVGLKLREDRPWDWAFETGRTVSEQQIDSSTKFRVHPMLFAALSIRK